MTQPIDPAEAASAQAAGMAAYEQRQGPAYDPMGGAELREAAPVAQPYVPPEPGEAGEGAEPPGGEESEQEGVT